LSSTATAQNWTPRTREVCDFSTQVPDMLKNTPKHVKVLYQPNLESTQNQPRFLRLKFWAQGPFFRREPES
jgi:hypothetical protein